MPDRGDAFEWLLGVRNLRSSEEQREVSRRWLEHYRTPTVSAESLLSGLVERLIEAGIPLVECSTSLHPLHPEIYAINFIWKRGAPVERHIRTLAFVSAVPPGTTPIRSVMEGGPAVRCRLDVPREQIPWELLRRTAPERCTEFAIFPLLYSDGRRSFFWCITDQPGGLTEAQVAMIESLTPLLSLRMELASAYAATDTLLETYLGSNAAKRVLAGAFKRGTGETVRAVVWYCDMRGFTSLVDARPLAEVVPLLNQYFEAVAGPVEQHGGEILKFIGDAMLAVFALPPGGAAAPCASALRAAEDAISALAALNRGDLAATPLHLGIALHLGEVMYGNIGARTRLDFTVIGATVNEAARVEGLCKELGVPLLVTEAFRAAAGVALAPMGARSLRGVSAPIALYTLPSLAPA